MQAIIDGRTYNTTTASEICTLPCSSNYGDFRYHETALYLTTKGAFFLAGKGGPLSMWAKSEGNGWSNGHGIKVVNAAEARMHMENANCGAEDFEACCLTLEEG